jgi:diguanylate cyclase (GGDEF)-like protein/PAS domain S-box-containing protein
VLKVLVIGPESLSGELGPTVLGRPDVDREHVPDAAQAVEVAESGRPHLVVLDLPRADAAELARRLRANPVVRPTAIVWLNRRDPPEAEAELAAAGVNAVIPVPIDPFLWDRRLEELLSVPARRAQPIRARVRDWSHFMHGTDEAEATVLNIGARGVLLEAEQPLELGAKLGLAFRLPGDAEDVAVVGQVVRVAESEGGLRRVGVEFLIYRGDARDRITRFVESDPGPERRGAPASALPLTVRPFGESREWEEELRASEIRKALILDSALDCIVTVDHEGRIIEFNAAARRVLGYSRSEILGREAADTIVPPTLRVEMRRRLRDIVVTGESADLGRRFEATALGADGELVPVEVAVVPAYVKGRVILTAYLRDLREKRRVERLDAGRQAVAQALTGSLSLAEAAPALLEALLESLECAEARLWMSDGPSGDLALAGSTSPARAAEGAGTDDAVARRAAAEAAATWDTREGPVRALAVPALVGHQALGVVEVRWHRPRPRDEAFVGMLGEVASQVGLFLRRQRAEADLQRFARYDSLTGLPNRSFFLETLDRTLSRAGHQRTRSALVFLDLDGFKAVNDGLGHAAGDLVLQTMAERLRAGTRSSDLVARIGGDEFTVLVPNLARVDDAALVARGLLDRLAHPCQIHDREVALSASAGISVFPEDGTESGLLLRHADLAMYRAKQEGKNTYRFFTTEMSERALERMSLLEGLRLALERDEFEVVYLPVIDRRGPPGLEALLRWRHPKLGLVTPAAFIAQAEESGLMLPIGARVLGRATRFVAGLARSDVRLAVNLSARQFVQPELVDAVRDALSASGLRAHRLELDLTEATVMTEAEDTKARLRQLRELRVELALDDFGTGYFSIGRLQELGFRRLKIDRTVVAGLPASRERAAQVEAILALAASLGIGVVAEGVETEAQRAFLEARHCTGLQGYLISPPLAPEDVPAFLERHPR